jgi:hypothetical protein
MIAFYPVAALGEQRQLIHAATHDVDQRQQLDTRYGHGLPSIEAARSHAIGGNGSGAGHVAGPDILAQCKLQ